MRVRTARTSAGHPSVERARWGGKRRAPQHISNTHHSTRTHISSRRRRIACTLCPRDMYRSVGRLSHSCGTALFSTLHPRSTPPEGVAGTRRERTARPGRVHHMQPHLKPVSAAPEPTFIGLRRRLTFPFTGSGTRVMHAATGVLVSQCRGIRPRHSMLRLVFRLSA